MKGKLGRYGVIAIVTMVLLGGVATAAVLSYYGEITGTADVDQAVLLDGQTQDQGPISYDFNTNPAGKTYIETHNLTSTVDSAASVNFETRGNGVGQGSQGPLSSMDIDWGGGMKGVDTRYVEVFDDAGADFSGYTSPSTGDADVVVTDSDDLQTEIDGAASGATILVESGSYNGTVEVSTSDLTVVAENRPDGSSSSTVSGAKTGFRITANGVTVKGFEVAADSPSTANARGIDIQAQGVTVESNYVHDVVAEERPIGIFLYGDSTNTVNVNDGVVNNNYVADVQATELQGSANHGQSKTRGIALEGDYSESDGVAITYNTVTNIGDDTNSAMSNGIEVYGGSAQNFTVSYNEVSDVDHNEDTTVFSGGPYTPRAAGFYVTGYNNGEVYGASHGVNQNNFLLSSSDHVVDVKHWDNPDAGTLDANDNYWDTDGIQYGVQDVLYTENSGSSEIAVSWMTKSDLTLEPGEVDEFGIINDFATNLKPGDYTVNTKITPD